MYSSFRQEIIREIKKSYTIIAIVVSFLLFFILIGLVFFIQGYQLNAETKEIAADFEILKEQTQMAMKNLNNKTVSQYLSGSVNERYLYQQFYEQTSILGDQASLIIIENNHESFKAGKGIEAISFSYMQTVIHTNEGRNNYFKVNNGSNGQKYLLYFSKIPNKNTYSILCVNASVFVPTNLQYGSQYIIADNFDNVYVKNTNQFVNGSLEKVESSAFNTFYRWENGHLYFMKQKSLTDNLFLYTLLLSFPIGMLGFFGLISAVLLLFFLLLQSIRMAKKIGEKTTHEINLLVEETSKIKDGQKKNITLEMNNEFQFLVDSINTMVMQRDKMTQQQLFLEKQNNRYEKKMLEAQFNPHFLYNTLENIRITSKFDTEITEKLILSLTRVLRYSIDHGEEETNLFKDMNVLQDFMEVNAIRFEKFSYEIEISKELYLFSVPRLFLLPLVENSLKYGMKAKEELSIKIVCKKVDDEIQFMVIDNGPGFSQELIEDIYHQLEKETHHGLINSYRRLRMMYPYSDLKIESSKEETSVSFIIWGELTNV